MFLGNKNKDKTDTPAKCRKIEVQRNTAPVEIIYTDPRFESTEPEHAEFVKPTYGTEGSAAVDLRACVEEAIVVKPGERVMIPAGFNMWINDINMDAKLLPRSGLGTKKGIVLGNLVGLLDSDYQDGVGICIWNSQPNVKWVEEAVNEGLPHLGTHMVAKYNEEAEFTINPGDRVCQMELGYVVHADWKERTIEEGFTGTSTRKGGLGHTGVK